MWANVIWGLPLVYNTSSGPVAGKLNVHLVPHTHDDVGWLKTVDQYYTGSNNAIQNAAVHLILDNVIAALQENSNRKFIYVEQLGFDALYFARIDYQDKLKRLNDSAMEMVWQASKTLGSSSQIFTGALYDFYGPPAGFDFDMDSTDTPIQDDPMLFDFNVQERVEAFVTYAQTQASYIRTNHIMWTMGSDFNYQNAHGWFKQMDKFINWVNLDGRVNAFYSTPSIYTDAKYAANESWPLKQDDFFPYADCPHCYWTGYFTSRSALKGYVRMLSSYYMMARQLEYFVQRRPDGPNTDALGEAMAISQHHDAVSGTEKQHTANDYAKRLSIASSEAMRVVNFALGCLSEGSRNGICQYTNTNFTQCPLLNVSYCPIMESNTEENGALVVVAYNSLGWNRTEYIRIPVNSKYVQVTDSLGVSVPSQLLPISNVIKELRSKYVQAYLGITPGTAPAFWLVFPATVPALGYNTFIVTDSNGKGVASMSHIEVPPGRDPVTVGHDTLQLSLAENGLISEMLDTKARINISLQASYLYYIGNKGSDGQGTDGAYLFRPAVSSPTLVNTFAKTSIITGPLVHEVWQEFTPWVSQITRLYKEKDYAEVEFVIGGIPIDDDVGKDVILRFTTNIESSGIFYTDSNGRDFIRRVRDYRTDWSLQVNEPVAGNYYPLNLGIFMNDLSSEFSVLVDRAVGGASIKDGQLELMLHRRLLYDDARGVGEALNETMCLGTTCEGLTVQGKLFLHINPPNEGSRWRRSMGQQVYSPLQLAFTTLGQGEAWKHTHFPSFSGMSMDYNLPANVALITLQELKDGHTLLRLAHLYESDEDVELSAKAYVELKKVFPNRQIREIQEMNLSATQEKLAMKARRKWKVEGNGGDMKQAAQRGGPVDEIQLIVELGPMEIRTFLLTFV